jgi:hypothetical protein
LFSRNEDENSRSGNSAEEQDLFEEFSDSLTELRVGKKLYQSGDEVASGDDSGQTNADMKSIPVNFTKLD